MVMMTSVGQLVSADCLSASLINFGLSIQTGRLRWKHSHRQVGLARRCTDEEHADICGVARGIWCADIALNQQRFNIPSYKINCKSRGILDRTGLGYIT